MERRQETSTNFTKADSAMEVQLRDSIRRHMILFLRLFLGSVFCYAAYGKILHPGQFGEVVYRYQILPDWSVNAFALFLPWLEAIAGISLVLGFFLPGSLFLIGALLMTFIGSLVYNVMRGLNVDCGCFMGKAVGGNPKMAWDIGRDAFLLVMTAVLFRSSIRVEIQVKDDTQ